MTLFFLCRTEDVEDNDLKQFYIKEKEILVINKNKKFYCLQARCTHAGAPLAEGELENDVLKCPWHGSRFNIQTGEVVQGPAKNRLPVYVSVVKDNSVFVDL